MPFLTSTALPLQPKKFSVKELATPTANVSAFCRAVLCRVVPDEFWGIGENQTHNINVLMQNTDRFVKLRRFENFSLHDVTQGMKVCMILYPIC